MKITTEQLAACWALWINDSSLRSQLRFGQYVWNKFGGKDPGERKTWPELFYASSEKAWELLWKETQR